MIRSLVSYLIIPRKEWFMIISRCRDVIPVNPFVIALVTQAVFSSELIFSSMNFCNERNKKKVTKATAECKMVTSISGPHNDTQVLMRLYARQDNTGCLKQDNNHYTHSQQNNYKSGRQNNQRWVQCIQT